MDGVVFDQSTANCVAKPLRVDTAGHFVRQMYNELRRMASSSLKKEQRAYSLQTTELVHEAYLKLVNQDNIHDMDGNRFRAAVANVIRRILVDHARARRSLKRGGNLQKVPLDEALACVEACACDVIALDESLKRLAAIDKRKSQVVELRFFGGVTIEEVASCLGLTRRTVERDWTFAKAWLRAELST